MRNGIASWDHAKLTEGRQHVCLRLSRFIFEARRSFLSEGGVCAFGVLVHRGVASDSRRWKRRAGCYFGEPAFVEVEQWE